MYNIADQRHTKPSIAALVAVAAVGVFLGWPGVAAAHAPDQGYIFISIRDDAVIGRVEMTVTDLNEAAGLELAEDGTATLEQIRDKRAIIVPYLQSRIALAPDGPAGPLDILELDTHTLPLGQYVVANFAFTDLPQRPETVEAEYRILFDVRPSHRGFLVVEHNWQTGTFNDEANIALVFTPDDTQQVYQVEGSVWQGFMAMIGQGAHHIWIGIDHILFLLALLLPSVVRRDHGRWVPVEGFKPAIIYVVKVVTVFTVAHTITLSAAALGALELPSRLVESIIALSIAIAAADILRRIFGNRIWLIVFVFGLFHGFGFASVLGDIGIGGDYLVHTLLGFNLGVELGQIVVVAAIFPILFLLRGTHLYTRIGLPAGAIVLITISMYWFVERGFNIDLPAGAIAQSLVSRLV